MGHAYQKLAMGLILFWSLSAFGFYDDLCFNQKGQVSNCLNVLYAYPSGGLSSNTCNDSGYANQSANCLGNLVFNEDAGGFRSMVHTDAIYLIAQAVGFLPRVAFFLALYGDSPDHPIEFQILNGTQFETDTNPRDRTIPADALSRYSPIGSKWHFPLVNYAPSPAPSQNMINPQNTSEGISRIRGYVLSPAPSPGPSPCWANLGSNLAGSMGPLIFGGASCFLGTLDDEPGGELLVQQQGGNVKFDDTAALTAQLAKAGTIDNGNPVPVSVFQTGLYLHTLLDRVSHNECVAGTLLKNDKKKNALTTSQTKDAHLACGVAHPYNHYLEVGAVDVNGEPAQSAGTEAALILAYSELAAFYSIAPADLKGKPSSVLAPALAQSIANVLSNPEPCVRLVGMSALATSFGLIPLPGQPASLASCPEVKK